MKHYYQYRLARYSLWIDILLLNITFWFIHWSYSEGEDLPDRYFILQLALNLSWLTVTYFLRTYELSRLDMTADVLLMRFQRAILLEVLIITGLLYFSKYGESISRLVMGGSMLGFGVLGSITRLLALGWLRNFRKSGKNNQGYLTIGQTELGEIIRNRYLDRSDLGLRYQGTFVFGIQSLASELQRLECLVEEAKPEYIYCDMTALSPEQVRGIISLGERQKAQIRLVPDFRGFLPNQATMQYHDVVPVIEVSTRPYSNVRDETIKRIFDLAFSLVVMVLGAPIFLLVVVMVKTMSSGPVFFRQERTGRWGKPFHIYKFRTMHTDSDRHGLMHSQGHSDPRVTPIGRFLRRSRLDELPQFINVVKGEMSVVGPRPLFRYDVDMLMEAAPEHFKKLLTVNPGITSIGQLRVGYADTLSLNLTRMRIDLQYLRKYSVWYDLYLILLTMLVMVSGRGK